MRKLYLVITSSLLIFAYANMYAQGHLHSNHERARHNNFYHKVELNYGNLYSFALSSCLTGVINYLIDDTMFETGLSVPIYREQAIAPYSFSRQNLLGVKLNDLVHNFDGGIKLGYQTYDPRFVNFGICAVASYKHDPFLGALLQDEETLSYQASIQRLLFGGNVMLYLGEMGMSTQVIIEAGIRYSYGLAFKDPSSLGLSEHLKNGWVSHYAVSIGGPGFFQNIKLFADVTHFSLIDSSHLKLSPIYVGLSWTVTPQQSSNKR